MAFSMALSCVSCGLLTKAPATDGVKASLEDLELELAAPDIFRHFAIASGAHAAQWSTLHRLARQKTRGALLTAA